MSNSKTMLAWHLTKPGLVDQSPAPIKLIECPIPIPATNEVLVKVLTCGVCHTDLHVTEGDLPIHQEHVTPGHEIVGEVVANGSSAHRFQRGDRIGIPWFRQACGVCRFCRSGQENLCPHSTYTGWDHDGGYAQYVTVPEGFAYRLPKELDPVSAAPLLCAGIIGYRAFKRARVPAGGSLGLYGFGGSASLCAQLALHEGIEVHVFTRGLAAQAAALKMGCASAQGAYDPAPKLLDSAILFSPAGEMVPNALANLAPGGTLAIGGIHLSDIPSLNYQAAIFHEKNLTSVESNTRQDGEEWLALAHRLKIIPHTTEYPFDQALAALQRVKKGNLDGALVLKMPQ